ncbi:hypothetical protein JXO52_15930 [bacterium]|nr:hypothetical protein [bacterium]
MNKAVDLLIAEITDAAYHAESLTIIISGAGTSGRLAMLMASQFNDVFSMLPGAPAVDFIIAGGPLALIKAQEGAEDDPRQGIEDLKEAIGERDRFVYIGITCGFSASYVAGQLYHTIVEKERPAFLIGFNPLERARTVVPENWDRSFADVIEEIRESPVMIFLNPVIGPEPVTGSTRMKGGTATKIILEMLFYLTFLSLTAGCRKPGEDPWNAGGCEDPEMRFRRMLDRFAAAVDGVYEKTDALAPIMEQVGKSLNNSGHIYYLGENASGKLGIVDASECPPTYGADFHDVRGFIEEGWTQFCPSCQDHSFVDNLYDIGFDNFRNNILPAVTPADTIIMTGSPVFYEKHEKIFSRLSDIPIFRILLQGDERPGRDLCRRCDIVITGLNDPVHLPILTSLQMKLIYNAVTTAAHIFKGKVFRNKMIDLRISNNKLYYRSIQIIRELMAVSEKSAEEALLKSIYMTDLLNEEILKAPVSKHIEKATDKEKIVPLALVLATGRYPVKAAYEQVRRVHIIRTIIEELNTREDR